MPRNGSGVYSLVTTPFATAGAIAVASTVNANINDIGTEITGSLPRNGSAAMTAALAMGSNKITGLASGTAVSDAPTLAQAQSSVVSQATAVGGTVDAITLTFSPVYTAYTSGMRIRWVSGGANTVTNPTVNVDSLGTKTVKKGAGSALVAGDTGASGYICVAVYNGTDFLLLNPALVTVSGVAVSATTLAASETLALTGDITPSQITADQDNYAPTGHATAVVLRLSTDALRYLTGLQGESDGRVVAIHNVGSQVLGLKHDTTSTAANRFYTPGGIDMFLAANASCLLQYDATASRWLVAAQSIGYANQTVMEAASASASYVNPANQHHHPGHPKFWAMVSVSGGTPTLQTSYNVNSITDTATGRLTVTIETDFSSANWAAIVTIERASTATGNSDMRTVTVRSGQQAAGSVQVDCFDDDAPHALKDPSAWHLAGLGDQ